MTKGIAQALEAEYTFEIIFIDDGSTDASWSIISELKKKYVQVKGVRFRRNYGKSVALQAGFERALGTYVVTMDADLQDDPKEVPEMVQMLKDGDDLVSGWKQERYDPISKTIPSKFFNFVTRKAAGIHLHDFNCGLKAYKQDVVKNIYVYGELHRYIPMLAKREGFTRISEKVVTHHARKYGHTKFGLSRFMNGFLDLVTLLFVQRYLQKPMHFFGSLGTLSFLTGFLITAWVIGDKIYRLKYELPVREVVDQPLFFLALVALIIGVQLFLTGFIAEMMAMRSHSNDEYLIEDRVGIE